MKCDFAGERLEQLAGMGGRLGRAFLGSEDDASLEVDPYRLLLMEELDVGIGEGSLEVGYGTVVGDLRVFTGFPVEGQGNLLVARSSIPI